MARPVVALLVAAGLLLAGGEEENNSRALPDETNDHHLHSVVHDRVRDVVYDRVHDRVLASELDLELDDYDFIDDLDDEVEIAQVLTPIAAPIVPHRWTHDDVVLALAGQPVMTRRIIFCEVGRSGRYDPYAVGSMGEIGPAQLLPGRGNGLSIFYSWGGVDPHSPYDAVWFVNEVQRRGMIGSQYPRTSRGCVGSP